MENWLSAASFDLPMGPGPGAGQVPGAPTYSVAPAWRSRPGLARQHRDLVAVALLRRIEGGLPVAVPRARLRAVGEQQLDGLGPATGHRPVQRRAVVFVAVVRIGTLF